MTRKNFQQTALAIALALALFGAQSANAADLGGKVLVSDPEPIRIGQSVWSGFYLGGHLGGTVDGDNDFLGGIHLGHNWQDGNVVYGAEGDVSFSDDTFGSVRGRLGFGANPWLLYGTAGVAFDDSDAGVVAGGGLEYKISDMTSAGVEALYYDIDDDFTVIRGRLTWHFGGRRY